MTAQPSLERREAPSADVRPSPAFYIRDLPVYGDLVLAPMEGYSDLPFRSLCRSLGSALSYTEFINALDILQGNPGKASKLAFLPEERPVVFQLFDSEPERLLEAALRLRPLEPDVLDINLGCAARTVSGRGAGAGLLRTPHKIARIFQLLTRSLDLPITAKIRLGWDQDSRNYLEVARIIAENGGALIAVHGRTRQQGYGGQADWAAIAEIKQAVNLPVLANGDVRTVADIARIKAQTGCEGVMIGRGAIGNPWIFARRELQEVPPQEVGSVMLRHLERMLAFYGPELGLLRFRKHADGYLRRFSPDPEQRRRLLTTSQPDEFRRWLHELIESPA